MLRRNPTRLDLRQEDIDCLERLREEYHRYLATQRTQTIGKGKRKSVELEEQGANRGGESTNGLVADESELLPEGQQQEMDGKQQQQFQIEGHPIVGTEVIRNKRKNITTAQRIGL
ncbi:hypothetical protein G9A89_018546 [Geosiphon pyriformis]|nr:hypothetical protein G9A89_018546 [Geosiphon pyriformis]